MIKSMTGAGGGRSTNESFDISVRAQSVNGRYLDVYVRIPNGYADFENEVSNRCRERLDRGKVEIRCDIKDLRDDAVSAALNEPVVNAYLDAARRLSTFPEVQGSVDAASVLSFPHALKMEAREMEDPQQFRGFLLEALDGALDELITARSAEGDRLREDISARLAACEGLLGDIEGQIKSVRDEYLQRIRDRIAEMVSAPELDQARLEQEVAYLVDKSDISEEITRLRSHFAAATELLDAGDAVGKKLDFTVQEMNREANTIGSKSKNIEINRAVIDMKSEIEKIREQVQNIE